METETRGNEMVGRCDQCGATAPHGSRWCSEECYLEYKQELDAAYSHAIDRQIDEVRLRRAEFKFYVEKFMDAIKAAKEF